MLNLIGVGGFKESKIYFLYLKSCYWIVSNVLFFLVIVVLNFFEFRLKCNKFKFFVLDIFKLVKFYFFVEDVEGVSFFEFGELDILEVVFFDVYRLFRNIRFGNKIRKFVVDLVKMMEYFERFLFGLGIFFEVFFSIVFFILSYVIWLNIKIYF